MVTLESKALRKSSIAVTVGLIAMFGIAAIGELYLDHLDLRHLRSPLVVLIIVAMAVSAFYDNRARRLARSLACHHCGYDVRGLDRCPECGREVEN